MSDRLLRAFAFVAIVSLGLSTGAVISVVRVAEQREQDRVTAGIEACERGNDFRADAVALGRANARLVRDVVEARNAISDLNTDQLTELNVLLEAGFANQSAAVDQIVQIDCRSVVPGATKEQP